MIHGAAIICVKKDIAFRWPQNNIITFIPKDTQVEGSLANGCMYIPTEFGDIPLTLEDYVFIGLIEEQPEPKDTVQITGGKKGRKG